MSDIRMFSPLWGNWEIVSKLGEGSFGSVWKIRRPWLDGRFYEAAVKHISIPKDESEFQHLLDEGVFASRESAARYYQDMLQSLLEEIDTMHTLQGYTNIVSYEDHDIIPKEDGIGYDIFLRMELLTPLTVRMREQMTTKDVVHLGIDISTAIDVLNRYHLVHRDIKPQNIFVNATGDYKLGDYGTARAMESAVTAMSRKGTYNYMAPEIYRNQPADSRVDMYSLGLVMYRLMNGNRLPFLPLSGNVSSEMNENAMLRRFSGEPLPPPKYADAALSGIILKACAFRPEDRYINAQELKQALEAYNGEDQVVQQAGDDSAASDSHRFHFGSSAHGTSGSFRQPSRSIREKRNDAPAVVPSPEAKTVVGFEAVDYRAAQLQAALGGPLAQEKKKKRWPAVAAVLLVAAVAGAILFLNNGGSGSTGQSPAGSIETAADSATEPTLQNTPVPTAESPAVQTQEVASTVTPEATTVPTATPEPTAMATATHAPTAVPTATPEPTAAPTATATPTVVRTETLTPTATPEPTLGATETPEPTPTATPVPTAVPTTTPTPALTAEELYARGIACLYVSESERDTEQGMRYLLEAAEAGSAEAQEKAGEIYYTGAFGNQDYALAAKYFRLAAEQGKPMAQYNLGYMYQNGLGVGQSYEMAIVYYQMAADQGSSVAQYSLGFLYKNGLGVNPDPVKAFRYYKLAADNGDEDAQYQVAACYRDGIGTEQNDEEALRYFELSASQGNDQAREEAAELRKAIPLKPYRTVGNIITFGHYEQDNNSSDGTEPIEWIVLDVQNGKSLLLSRYALDVQPFHTDARSVAWKDCFLRNWLNQDFLKEAFTKAERAAVLTVEVDNSAGQGYSEWNVSGGSNTEDRIFLLSYHEAFDLYLKKKENRMCAPTDYAAARGAWTSGDNRKDGREACWWWLRSPGRNQDVAIYVFNNGSRRSGSVSQEGGCIRPAFWLDPEAAVLQRSNP